MANELIPNDADHPNVLHALVRKRAEISGKIELCQLDLRRLIGELDHVDATIRVFNPNIDVGNFPVEELQSSEASCSSHGLSLEALMSRRGIAMGDPSAHHHRR
jgi:hypothetical protein